MAAPLLGHYDSLSFVVIGTGQRAAGREALRFLGTGDYALGTHQIPLIN
jgi:hypothetical protein